MKNRVVRFFQKNNLFDTKMINSLLVTFFVSKKKIKVTNNQILLNLLNYNFEKKEALQEELLKIICDDNASINLELLIQLFESVVSPSTRIVNGAVYTPENIRHFILERLVDNFDDDYFTLNRKVVDLSCGCGAFLLDSAIKIKKITNHSYFQIFKSNIYGIDIEEYAIERSKILLSLLAVSQGEDRNFEFNLITADSLTYNWKLYDENFLGFDLVVGNPPYVSSKHLTEETRKQLTTMQTCRIGNPDLYIPFFEIAIENLAAGGVLGFITMNSFFKSLNARNLRKYFQSKSLDFKLIDFGAEQIFQSRNTYTCICIITNVHSKSIKYARTISAKLSEKISFSKILYQELDSHNGWNLYAHKIINKIEKTGIPLGLKHRTSHGLATLKNDIYIFTPTNEDGYFYYLITKEGKEYQIEKSICKPVINSNKLSRKSDFQTLKEQLIFPYSNETRPKLLSESFFREKYPKSYLYLYDHKDLLSLRDKGNGKYQEWYAFGRSQGLEKIRYKMFFPKYSDVTPHYLIHSDPEAYFYNGQAFLGCSTRELEILKKILETRLFWFYIRSTSKPYTSNYYSLNGIYIKNFGICELTKEEEQYILSESNKNKLDVFFERKYAIDEGTIDKLIINL